MEAYCKGVVRKIHQRTGAMVMGTCPNRAATGDLCVECAR